MNNQATIVENEEKVIETLRDIRRGGVIIDLEDAMKECVNSIMDNDGGTATVSLKVTMKYDPQTGSMKVSGDVVSKPQKKKVHASLSSPHQRGICLAPIQTRLNCLIDNLRPNTITNKGELECQKNQTSSPMK